jgi:uncharacterized protein
MIDEDVIVVTATGTAAAAPDGVRAHVGLSVPAPTVAEALTAAAAGQERIVEELLAAGVDRSAIRTVAYQAGEDYGPAGPVKRHRADATLEICLPDIGRVGELLARLAEVVGDGLRINSVQPDLGDPEPARQEARAAAVVNARRQAEELADAAGVRLGRLRSLVEGSGGGGGGFQLMPLSGPTAAAAPELEGGRHTIAVVVTAAYEIER